MLVLLQTFLAVLRFFLNCTEGVDVVFHNREGVRVEGFKTPLNFERIQIAESCLLDVEEGPFWEVNAHIKGFSFF